MHIMKRDLLNKYIVGDTTTEESLEVYNWIKASSENENTFKSLRKIHDVLIWKDYKAIRAKKRSKNRRLYLPILQIAGLFILFFFVYKAFTPPNKTEITNDYKETLQTLSVPAGEYIQFTLEDGTKVWLNSKSTLTYPTQFNDNKRSVELEGEAFFDVVSLTDKPFIVKISDHVVHVTGTEFNVKSYKTFETSLISGSVTVENLNNGKSVNLKSMESVVEINNEFIVRNVDENDLLWRKGIISIDNKTIDEIIPILEQYYDKKIIVENKKFQNEKKYTGKFRIKDGVEQILKILQMQNNISYQVEDDLIILN
ncbi:MAG: FecR family protein [Dysgonamonadaceae bacterium]|nr:FecR family protein [Dysgonamonadaceae bacterium]